ncbi:prenyltransferase [Halanaerobium sp.]|uniref:prenyltransferase n=1 Tax=Halanaerobium sp. TaxID=1895664 RepID=UPI000DE734D5|nr:prenyltransferase [Halanaerobium sp.]PUU92396.1 MAG: 1,4-dihydroxy-2-naphthoate octaprenyltransferase [Halanaerobium sp.]
MKKIKLLKEIWKASRPLSLTLALYSTTLGMAVAHLEGELFSGDLSYDLQLIFLITTAGLFVQTGTNFINDYFECEYKNIHFIEGEKYNFLGKKRSSFSILIFLLGILSFLITALLGLYIISITTKKLILIGALGIIGGYAYTGEPIVYKKRGLGTPLSFVLMGPLMVMGTHLAFSQHYSWRPIILGLPISLLIPVLMLSNELRDFERDSSLGIRTLTVRIGFKKAKILYLALLSSSYLLTIGFILLNLYPAAALLSLLTLPLAYKAYQNVAEAEKKGVPVTNQLHLTFGLIQLLALFLA